MGRAAGTYETAQSLTAAHSSRPLSNSNPFPKQLLPVSIHTSSTLPKPILISTPSNNTTPHPIFNSVPHESPVHRLLTDSVNDPHVHTNANNEILGPSPLSSSSRPASPVLPGYLGQSPSSALPAQALCHQLQDHRLSFDTSPTAHTEAQVYPFRDSFRECSKAEPTQDNCLQLPLQPNHVRANIVSHTKYPFLQPNCVNDARSSLSHPVLLSKHHSVSFL